MLSSENSRVNTKTIIVIATLINSTPDIFDKGGKQTVNCAENCRRNYYDVPF